MLSWLPQLTQFTVFLGIAGVGFLFLLVALVRGEIFEHLDVSADHDLGHGGPGFFSTRILSVFVTSFGGFGAVATFYKVGAIGSSAIGFVSGLFFAAIIYLFARFLYGQQATTEVRTRDLVGQHARVVVAIPAAGVGQVRCQVGEELVDKIARARDGAAVPENAAVVIEEVLGETVIVAPLARG